MARSSKAEVFSAIGAIGALAVSAYSLLLSYQANHKADEQAKVQNANKVYLGEAPEYAYSAHPLARHNGSPIWWVVMNDSGAQLHDVWVEGKNSTSVVIDGVQHCTMYALPTDFIPVAVDFADENGHWRRPVYQAPSPTGAPPPKKDTGDSPWFMDVEGCS